MASVKFSQQAGGQVLLRETVGSGTQESSRPNAGIPSRILVPVPIRHVELRRTGIIGDPYLVSGGTPLMSVWYWTRVRKPSFFISSRILVPAPALWTLDVWTPVWSASVIGDPYLVAGEVLRVMDTSKMIPWRSLLALPFLCFVDLEDFRVPVSSGTLT